LIEFKPEVVRAYPLPYIRWLVRDTLDLAAAFQLQSVPALRVFLQLRFDIAPGFFKEAAIAGVLADRGLQPMARWSRLAQPEFGDAWLRARTFSGADEWRARFWQAGSRRRSKLP
jgi:hypothetical protein